MKTVPSLIRGYHGTSSWRAEAIIREGFRDDKHRDTRPNIHFGSRAGISLAVGMARIRSIDDMVISSQQAKLGAMVPIIVADIPADVADAIVEEHIVVPHEYSSLIIVRGVIEVSASIPTRDVPGYFSQRETFNTDPDTSTP